MNDEMNATLFEALSNLQIQVERGPGGKQVAWISCPVCPVRNGSAKLLKLVRDPPRSWPIYNVDSHFRRHFTENGEDRSIRPKRQRRKTVPTIRSVVGSIGVDAQKDQIPDPCSNDDNLSDLLIETCDETISLSPSSSSLSLPDSNVELNQHQQEQSLGTSINDNYSKLQSLTIERLVATTSRAEENLLFEESVSLNLSGNK